MLKTRPIIAQQWFQIPTLNLTSIKNRSVKSGYVGLRGPGPGSYKSTEDILPTTKIMIELEKRLAILVIVLGILGIEQFHRVIFL